MASAQAILAGLAAVEVFVDDRRLRRGLKGALGQLQFWSRQIGKKLFAGGLAAATSLVGAAKLFAVAGDTIAKASARTGMTTERLSELKYAAERSGIELPDLEIGLRKLQRAIVEAGTGSGAALELFSRLGVTLGQLKGLTPDEQFVRVADALAKVRDPTERAAFALELFGRGGTALLPLVNQGRAGIDRLAARARYLGFVMDGETAAAAVKLRDTLADLWGSVNSLVKSVGAALAPLLTDVAESLLPVLKSAKEWVKQNRGLIEAILGAATAAMTFGAALYTSSLASVSYTHLTLPTIYSV
mgnify:CR=1 FL=1